MAAATDEIAFFWRESATPNTIRFLSSSRGLFGTPLSTGNNRPVEILAPTQAMSIWRPNLLYKRFLDKPREVKKLLNEILLCSGVMLYVNKEGLIDCKSIAAPLLEETVPIITDESSILRGSVQRLKTDKDQRFTRYNIYYVPKEGGFKAGNTKDDYFKRLLMWDLPAETADSYGFSKVGEPLYLQWVYRDVEAWFIGGLLSRVHNKAPVELKLSLDTKDAWVGLGEWFEVHTTSVRDRFTNKITGRPYQVKQAAVNSGRENIELVVTSFYWEDFLFRKVIAGTGGAYAGGNGQNFWMCGSSGVFSFDGSQGYSF